MLRFLLRMAPDAMKNKYVVVALTGLKRGNAHRCRFSFCASKGLVAVLPAAALLESTTCQFVDIGIYKHHTREAVAEALKPWWRLLLDGKRIAPWPFMGGYTVECSVVDALPRTAGESDAAEWQRHVCGDVVNALCVRDALPAMFVGEGPASAWVVLGRAMSHCRERPIVVDGAPNSGKLQVFDFRRINAWWLWPQQLQQTWRGPLLRATPATLTQGVAGNAKPAIVLFVTHDSRFSLAASERRLIEQHLVAQGFSPRVMVDVRPTGSASLAIDQSQLLGLQREMDAIVRDARHWHGNNGRLDAVAVVTTGPAPLAFVIGSVLSDNLHGELFTYELKARDSRR